MDATIEIFDVRISSEVPRMFDAACLMDFCRMMDRFWIDFQDNYWVDLSGIFDGDLVEYWMVDGYLFGCREKIKRKYETFFIFKKVTPKTEKIVKGAFNGNF